MVTAHAQGETFKCATSCPGASILTPSDNKLPYLQEPRILTQPSAANPIPSQDSSPLKQGFSLSRWDERIVKKVPGRGPNVRYFVAITQGIIMEVHQQRQGLKNDIQVIKMWLCVDETSA